VDVLAEADGDARLKDDHRSRDTDRNSSCDSGCPVLVRTSVGNGSVLLLSDADLIQRENLEGNLDAVGKLLERASGGTYGQDPRPDENVVYRIG
jgi:hypothetical protein